MTRTLDVANPVRRVLVKIFSVSGFAALFKLAQFLGVVLIENLFKGSDQAGKAFVFLSCVNIGIVLVNFGHTSFYSRLYSRSSFQRYKWRTDLLAMTAIGAVSSVLASAIFAKICNFGSFETLLMASALACFNFAYLVSAPSRAAGEYVKSFALQNSPNAIWPITLLILAITGKYILEGIQISAHVVVLIIASAYVAATLPALIWIQKKEQHANAEGLGPDRQESIVFYILALGAVGLPYVDKLLLGVRAEYLSYVAGYASVSAYFMVFDLMMVGLGWVLMPEFASATTGGIKISELLKKTAYISILMAVPTYLFAGLVLDVAYGGRYVEYKQYYLMFVMIGVTKIFFGTCSAYLTAKVRTRQLAGWGGVNLIILISATFAMYWVIPYYQVWGILASLLTAWLLRLIITLYFITSKSRLRELAV